MEKEKQKAEEGKSPKSSSKKSPSTEKKSSSSTSPSSSSSKSKETKEEKETKSPSKSSRKKESSDEEKVPESPKDRILKSGWLEKKGVIRHNWTKRWMVLERKTEIRYYKNTFDSVPKGSIPLQNASVYSHVEKKGREMPGYFNLRVGQRDFLLRAPNGEEKVEWVKAIKANITMDEEKSESTRKLQKTPSFLGVVKQ